MHDAIELAQYLADNSDVDSPASQQRVQAQATIAVAMQLDRIATALENAQHLVTIEGERP